LNKRILKGKYHCTVDLLFNSFVLQVKTKIVSCNTTSSKPDKQEVNGTVILPPLVFPACTLYFFAGSKNLGRALATKLKGTEPVGDPPRVRQHQRSYQPSPGPGIRLEKSPQLADDEGGAGSGGNRLPEGDGVEDQPLSRLPGHLPSRGAPPGNSGSFC